MEINSEKEIVEIEMGLASDSEQHDPHNPHRVAGSHHELHRHATHDPSFLSEYSHAEEHAQPQRPGTPVLLDTTEHHRYEKNQDNFRFSIKIKHDLDELVKFVDSFEDFHSLDGLEVARSLQVDPEQGLQHEQVERRREEFGDNSLDDGRQRFLILKIIAHQIFNALTIILLTVFVIAIVFEEWVEAGVVMAILILNATIASVQEIQSVRSLNAISNLAESTMARVIRSGGLFTIPINEVVLGDVIEVRQGDCAPADIRLIQCDRLEMDEALLTGETQPVDKNVASCPAETPLADRAQMVYRQTHVSEGHARGIAVAIGTNTEIGVIASRLSQKNKTAPIASVQQTLSTLLYVLFAVGVVMGVFILWAFDWNFDAESLVFASAALVAILPEASVVLATMILALGVKRMAKANSIVREAHSVERIGRVTDICSDKTGTLTEGRMRVSQLELIDATGESCGELFVDGAADSVTGSWRSSASSAPFSDLGGWLGGDRKESWENFMLIASLCSATELEEMPDGRLAGLGNPTEKALQALSYQAGYKRRELKDSWELRGEYGFDSSVKTMLTGYRNRISGKSLCLVKGAPERILDGWKVDGEKDSVMEAKKEEVLHSVQEMAKRGLRVLALAHRADMDFSVDTLCDFERADLEGELQLVGLVGLRDPPKQETPGAIRECAQAGITVRMLTGDHPDTASAIAREIGILPSESINWDPSSTNLIMTGQQIDQMADEELYSLDTLPLVVARCSPMSKVRIVEALHEKGRAVAMTGDGVNDAPAIKEADVGIAMGITGSDVTKSVGDIVLADDNFATIVVAVREGRRMQGSIRSVVSHLLCANVAEALAIMLALSFAVDDEGIPVYILSPLAILWVNVVSVSFPALFLANDHAPSDLMTRSPLMGSFLTRALIAEVCLYGTLMGSFSLACFSIVIWGEGDGTIGDDCNSGSSMDEPECDNVARARGATFVLLNTMLLLHALNCRHPTRSTISQAIQLPNFKLYLSIFGGICIGIPLLYIPTISDKMLKHTGISWEWGLVVGFVLLFMACSELFKYCRRAYFRRKRENREVLPLGGDSHSSSRDSSGKEEV